MKKKVEEKKETKELQTINTNSQGALVPNNLEQMYRMAKYYSSSGLMPKGLDSPEKVLVAMNLLRDLGLPNAAIRQVYVVNGTPNIWGDLPLACIRKSGKLEYCKEKVFDKDYNQICLDNKNLDSPPCYSWCEMKRSDTGEVIDETYSIEEAKTSGDYDKNYSVWQKHPRDMLKYKPRARVAKPLFADVLLGASIAEYDNNVLPIAGNVQEQIENQIVKPLNLAQHFLGTKEEKEVETETAEVIEPEVIPTAKDFIERAENLQTLDQFDELCSEINGCESEVIGEEADKLQKIIETKYKELKNVKKTNKSK